MKGFLPLLDFFAFFVGTHESTNPLSREMNNTVNNPLSTEMNNTVKMNRLEYTILVKFYSSLNLHKNEQ